MNISLKLTMKQARCNYCGEYIVKGEPQIKWSWKSRKGWVGKTYYHPDCFIDDRLHSLKINPPVTVTKKLGRPTSKLTSEQRTLRIKLMKYYSRDKGNPKKQLKLREQIKVVGGVPASWE